MTHWVRFVAGACLAAAVACATPTKDARVLIDHDAGAEDLIAMALVVRSAPMSAVSAVTVTPADSLPESAASATERVLGVLGAGAVPVFAGAFEGTNRFPDDWRKDAGRVLALPSVERFGRARSAPEASEDAPHAIARLLSAGGSFTILETGPLSNLAAALALNPSIAANITRIFAMGGAVRTAGNVDEPGRDGTAEWNIYNEPAAAAAVIDAGIPVTLIPLDATNKMPMTMAFVDRVRAQAASSAASRFAAEAWSLGEGQIAAGQYYFWDSLTAAAMIDPSIVTTETLRVRVVTSGRSQGRLVEDPTGRPVQVALDVDRPRAEKLILSILAR